MNRPIREFRSGAIKGAIWFNEKELQEGEKVGFKTISISRSFKKRDEDVWRSEIINLRKSDIPRFQVILNKIQEELLLAQEKGEENND